MRLSDLPPGVSHSDPHINPVDCIRCGEETATYGKFCDSCAQDLHDDAEQDRLAEQHYEECRESPATEFHTDAF